MASRRDCVNGCDGDEAVTVNSETKAAVVVQ